MLISHIVSRQDRNLNQQIKTVSLLSSPQAAIAASVRTLPTYRSKPSGRLYCACTTLTWWTDISPRSTTPRWSTRLTTPSSDTRGDDSEGKHWREQRHTTVEHPQRLKWSPNFLELEFGKISMNALCSAEMSNCASFNPFFFLLNVNINTWIFETCVSRDNYTDCMTLLSGTRMLIFTMWIL